MPKRKPYNVREPETRGKTYQETSIVKSFWIRHKMEEVEHLSKEELDAFIDKFYEVYEEEQIKHNPRFEYNQDPLALDKKYRKLYNSNNGT
jgi:hypothetical protein